MRMHTLPDIVRMSNVVRLIWRSHSTHPVTTLVPDQSGVV